jgi:CubicO group peptidase (beta-lactamase class C family)
VDVFLANKTTFYNLPGLIATVVLDQHTIWTKGYGRANHFDPASKPPTGDNFLKVASITKTFTSQLLFVLRDKGIVHLDDPVSKFIPEFKIKSPYRTKAPLTLRQLATHTSGIPRDLHYPCAFNHECNETEVFAMLSNMHLVVPPFTRFHYSNVGSALLGHCLARAANLSFADLLQQHFLSPIHMDGTAKIDNATLAKMAVGVSNGKPAPVVRLGWEEPCGGLLTSANGMATYLSYLFRTDQPTADGQVIDGTTVSESLSAQTLLRDGRWDGGRVGGWEGW